MDLLQFRNKHCQFRNYNNNNNNKLLQGLEPNRCIDNSPPFRPILSRRSPVWHP